MKRTAEEFRKAAAEHGIAGWPIHDCSICGYPCAYVFNADDPAFVAYDSGCDCVRYPSGLRPATWDEVANHYNMQSNPGVIEKYDAFWGFPALPSSAQQGEQK